MNIQLSTNFKKMTGRAIFAIILFIITYIILIILAVGMTAACVMGGIALIVAKPMVITIGLGIGLASLGFFILTFLFKFLFKKHTVDRSNLVEIHEEDEPGLFSFIREIVNEVKTDFPKKIYLSSDVNACVFYDSNFWSMIFPIRKNLQIGLGLINTTTEQEFKAILAHEFGHFSQRTMKVGSYVYNVNQIIFNMLYDNESFEEMIHRWASISGYFAIFVIIAVKIIHGIQWILRKMYDFVNIQYMALSREMEFHADEIAANVAGYLPLKEALLRMGLANHCYSEVLGYYDGKLKNNIKSNNIYVEQAFLINFAAEKNHLLIKNNLPIVSEFDLNKYNRSKLTIKNQWASHPSIEERVKALELVNIRRDSVNDLAIHLFKDKERTQKEITDKLFSVVEYKNSPTTLDFDEFKEEYSRKYNENSFPVEYNSYYEYKNPIEFDLDEITDFDVSETMDILFSKERVDMVYDSIALENDKSLLNGIINKEYNIKSFDYDGKKYKAREAKNLIPYIEKEQDRIKELILENDVKIFKFFHNKAVMKDHADSLKEKYRCFFKYDSDYHSSVELYNRIHREMSFVGQATLIEKVKENLKNLPFLEFRLKIEIKKFISDNSLRADISRESMDNFENYLSKDWEYFDGMKYDHDNLNIFGLALNDCKALLMRKYFLMKLDLLKYQIEQLEEA